MLLPFLLVADFGASERALTELNEQLAALNATTNQLKKVALDFETQLGLGRSASRSTAPKASSHYADTPFRRLTTRAPSPTPMHPRLSKYFASAQSVFTAQWYSRVYEKMPEVLQTEVALFLMVAK